MEINEQSLRQRYATMEIEQLLELRHRGTLTESALKVLEETIATRGGVPIELNNQIATDIKQHRVESEMLASYGARMSGQLFDFLIYILILLLPGSILVGIAFAIKSERFYQLSIILDISLAIGYWLFSDALPKGQTLGKRAAGTATVDAVTLKPCSFRQSFVRNIVPVVIGPFDWITLGNRKRQRVGDLAAGTMVINVAAPPSPLTDEEGSNDSLC